MSWSFITHYADRDLPPGVHLHLRILVWEVLGGGCQTRSVTPESRHGWTWTDGSRWRACSSTTEWHYRTVSLLPPFTNSAWPLCDRNTGRDEQQCSDMIQEIRTSSKHRVFVSSYLSVDRKLLFSTGFVSYVCPSCSLEISDQSRLLSLMCSNHFKDRPFSLSPWSPSLYAVRSAFLCPLYS